MRVGIPRGLLYCKYHPFFKTFFEELGAEIMISEETNKRILDQGVRLCVDEACLPVKVYHGHVASIKDQCDLLVIPRIMQIRRNEFICPKFCGLPEMIANSIPNLPPITYSPIYMFSERQFFKWSLQTGEYLTKSKGKIRRAFLQAVEKQKNYSTGIKNSGEKLTVMLAGHPYLLYDSFLNMQIVKKLQDIGVGIITEEQVDEIEIDVHIRNLYKKPFWSFQRNAYGAISYMYEQHKADGIIYLSSFACGIDSVVIDLIRSRIGEYPMLVLKLDEHTGEAGVDTRIEAFTDMLERRKERENHISTFGKYVYCG